MHRFFAPSLDPGDELVTLPKDEAEHLTRVLRLGAGELVSAFDGRGTEFLCRVATAVRRDVNLQLVKRLEPAAESPVHLTLAQAVLKGDAMDDIVRDAVMLGVSAIQPLVTKRSETTVANLIRSARVDRWRRIAVASVKQSHRAVLPEVRTPLTLESYLEEPAPALRMMLVEPSAEAMPDPLTALRNAPVPGDAVVLVGPEGGWTDEEWKAARSRGIQLITLGARTLRADAVPVAAISVLQFLWESA